MGPATALAGWRSAFVPTWMRPGAFLFRMSLQFLLWLTSWSERSADMFQTLHKSGYEVIVRIRAVPVHNPHGSIIGAVLQKS